MYLESGQNKRKIGEDPRRMGIDIEINTQPLPWLVKQILENSESHVHIQLMLFTSHLVNNHLLAKCTRARQRQSPTVFLCLDRH